MTSMEKRRLSRIAALVGAQPCTLTQAIMSDLCTADPAEFFTMIFGGEAFVDLYDVPFQEVITTSFD